MSEWVSCKLSRVKEGVNVTDNSLGAAGGGGVINYSNSLRVILTTPTRCKKSVHVVVITQVRWGNREQCTFPHAPLMTAHGCCCPLPLPPRAPGPGLSGPRPDLCVYPGSSPEHGCPCWMGRKKFIGFRASFSLFPLGRELPPAPCTKLGTAGVCERLYLRRFSLLTLQQLNDSKPKVCVYQTLLIFF